MKKTNKIILASAIVAVLLLGIGYAAIQNITLNINGTAAADPSQSNFKVMFSGTPTVSDDTYVTAAITDDTNATINVEGLTKKGDVVTATYTVQNASTDLSADLGVSTTNSNTEYFTLSSEIAQTSLVAGEATTLTVTVELTKTPITESVSATIGVQLEAMPIQPGEEGTSEGINDFSQTPDNRNEFGFYFEQPYSVMMGEEKGTIIFYEDTSFELYVDGKILQKFPVGSTTYDSFTIDGTSIDMGILTVSSDGRQIIIPTDPMDDDIIFELDLSFTKATVPEGAIYIHIDETTNTAEIYESFPIDSNDDWYIYGDYMYHFSSDIGGWSVGLFAEPWASGINELTGIQMEFTDYDQTSYGPILESINGAPIVEMIETFMGCSNLVTAPEIPSGVNRMSHTFTNCTSLTGEIIINANPEYYSGCFAGVDFEKQNLTLGGSSTKLAEIGATGINYK
ncbi:MAG: hypothetical protein IKL55_07245 [Clostridia bacterium]|nr:hypothetical protein [Clostridia bacterium]